MEEDPVPGKDAISHKSALIVALRYAAFAALWIVFSDRVLQVLVRDSVALSAFQTLKGWLFVIVTSFLLYGLVLAELLRLATVRKAADAERDRNEQRLERALADREALLREVHHRVKNNLQVVASLMSLERGRLETELDRSILDDLGSRVRAMSIVYERLHRSESMDRVRLDDYVDSLFETLGGASSTLVDFENRCGAIALNLDAAVPLGLLVNELALNALKFAGKGRTFVLEAALADGRLMLRASDNGPGYPALPPVREGSLGLVLVDNLARQLGGLVRYSNSDGAVAEIDLPMPETAREVPLIE